MQYRYLTYAFYVLILCFWQQGYAQCSLTVVVKKVRGQDGGQISIGLFNSASSFPKKQLAYKGVYVPVNNRNVVCYTFTELPAGDYAVAIGHDANSDQKLNTNILGIPKEGFGFSRDALGMFGPPDFKAARVGVRRHGGDSVEIHLRY